MLNPIGINRLSGRRHKHKMVPERNNESNDFDLRRMGGERSANTWSPRSACLSAARQSLDCNAAPYSSGISVFLGWAVIRPSWALPELTWDGCSLDSFASIWHGI